MKQNKLGTFDLTQIAGGPLGNFAQQALWRSVLFNQLVFFFGGGGGGGLFAELSWAWVWFLFGFSLCLDWLVWGVCLTEAFEQCKSGNWQI